MWPTRDAKAHAIFEGGKLKRVIVTEPGAGYCSAPEATVEGHPDLKLRVTLGLSKDLAKNGTVSTIDKVNAASIPAAKSTKAPAGK